MSNKEDIVIKIISAVIVLTLVCGSIFYWRDNITDFLVKIPGPYGNFFAVVLEKDLSPIIKVNGETVTFTSQKPVMKNGYTLVPARDILKALGASISWDAPSQIITTEKGDTTVKFQLGKETATKNGVTIPLDVPTQLVNNVSMIPLRFVSESFGALISYDDKTNTVFIDTGTMAPKN